MSVLIISSLADEHAVAVMQSLAARADVTTELLDLAEFPTRLSVSMEFAHGTRRCVLRRRSGGQLDLSGVRAVWWRRPRPFGLPPELRDPEHRRFALSEANTAFQGLYQCLEALWVNPPGADAAAAHKPWQLAIAQEVGLDIPPTLMTSDPEEARAFWARHPDAVIYKQFLALPETWRETRRLREEDAKLGESVRHAPVIFQRHVPAVADIRVIAIGEAVFAAAADVRSGPYPDDVRFNLEARYVPHELPDDVAKKVCGMMARMGLVYGAADFRLVEDGRYVFLEINPAGQFLYIEQSTGQQISAALASCLADARPPALARWP